MIPAGVQQGHKFRPALTVNQWFSDDLEALIVSPHRRSGMDGDRLADSLFTRWLSSCAIDYALLISAILFFALGWPGGHDPLAAVTLIVLVQLLYQPLGELLGGTLGQRLAGIRLIAPGEASTTSIATVIRRHGERMGIVWGVLAAHLYWRKHLGAPMIGSSATESWEWADRRRVLPSGRANLLPRNID